MTFRSRSIIPDPQALVQRDLAEFGVARFRDLVFDAVLMLWRRRQSEGWTQQRVAKVIGRDPAWVSRNLSAPANWTLRTVGELVQALEGEADIRIDALDDPLPNPENFDAYDGYEPSKPTVPDINFAGVFSMPPSNFLIAGVPL